MATATFIDLLLPAQGVQGCPRVVGWSRRARRCRWRADLAARCVRAQGGWGGTPTRLKSMPTLLHEMQMESSVCSFEQDQNWAPADCTCKSAASLLPRSARCLIQVIALQSPPFCFAVARNARPGDGPFTLSYWRGFRPVLFAGASRAAFVRGSLHLSLRRGATTL